MQIAKWLEQTNELNWIKRRLYEYGTISKHTHTKALTQQRYSTLICVVVTEVEWRKKNRKWKKMMKTKRVKSVKLVSTQCWQCRMDEIHIKISRNSRIQNEFFLSLPIHIIYFFYAINTSRLKKNAKRDRKNALPI